MLIPALEAMDTGRRPVTINPGRSRALRMLNQSGGDATLWYRNHEEDGRYPPAGDLPADGRG